MQALSEHLYIYPDTCKVYVVKNGAEAVLIDFGSGDVLDCLSEIGVTRVSAVLMTHHHRDQGQGLARAAAAGIPIWVPHMEQELFAEMDAIWQSRQVLNNYNVRQERFSLLDAVPIAGTLKDYESYTFGGCQFQIVPTPGHTPGSISVLARIDGRLNAFTGDLIAGPGKLWSLAATQWTYNGGEGLPATAASLLDLQERGPERLLPSHGETMDQPVEAIASLIERLREMMKHRQQNPRLFQFLEQPFEPVTPHLLRSRNSESNYFVLLSESGKAMFLDFGYDFHTGKPAETDRAARRPWLRTLGTLKKQYGVTKVETVVPTHYHDDHVAGFNLLRDHEGTEVWAADTFAGILRHPERYDLPCLWYDPIPVDRELPLETPIAWEEYQLTLYPLPGHTRYAVAIALEVDGRKVLVAGDQYQGGDGLLYNYVYKNRFDADDYMASAALYKKLQPDVILTGHWDPLWVEPGYFEELDRRGEALARMHRELLPLEQLDYGAEGFGARIVPYQSETRSGETVTLEIEVRNPLSRDALVEVDLLLPSGWHADPPESAITLAAKKETKLSVRVTPNGLPVRRARIAADLKVNGMRIGQHAESLITIKAHLNEGDRL
ncbi:MBL fold metallo-hydrolase [Paenibacillus rhizovicinus]|uniref:MBL fold metallo-hydrolase n=1 Tax=Paenibacillus rhizovicinus TaxID=2704463 RepID=A0A6C0P5N2_9BACL|nr:MBL fold metallo-hydrolase [Paenibacillus rhizovicinus]QHW33661.1 MBL fold metallo-hydrolase [Paenibacillus rhizovicinus]